MTERVLKVTSILSGEREGGGPRIMTGAGPGPHVERARVLCTCGPLARAGLAPCGCGPWTREPVEPVGLRPVGADRGHGEWASIHG